jgi:predicted RNA-binding protein with PUA-like domain
MNYWLLKSEPDSFSIDDLAAATRQTAAWDGVRNFQARNMLRDSMKKGDQAFFYHSSCELPGIAGIVSVVKEGYPDKTADEEQRWFVVDVKLVRKFKHIIALEQLRVHQSKALRDLVVLRRGNRLSVTPVTKKDWLFVLSLE